MKNHSISFLSFLLQNIPFGKNCLFYLKLCIFLFLAIPSFAQSQPTDARVTFTPAGSANVSAAFFVNLPDSSGITDVDIKLIDTLEDVILFERNFEFDQSSGLPPGITWQRNGTEVNLGIGSHIQKIAYLGKVRLKNTAGHWSNWYEFLFN